MLLDSQYGLMWVESCVYLAGAIVWSGEYVLRIRTTNKIDQCIQMVDDALAELFG